MQDHATQLHNHHHHHHHLQRTHAHTDQGSPKETSNRGSASNVPRACGVGIQFVEDESIGVLRIFVQGTGLCSFLAPYAPCCLAFLLAGFLRLPLRLTITRLSCALVVCASARGAGREE
jgi:hypothetical protein